MLCSRGGQCFGAEAFLLVHDGSMLLNQRIEAMVVCLINPAKMLELATCYRLLNDTFISRDCGVERAE